MSFFEYDDNFQFGATSDLEFIPDVEIETVEYVAIDSAGSESDNTGDEMFSEEELRKEYWPFLE